MVCNSRVIAVRRPVFSARPYTDVAFGIRARCGRCFGPQPPRYDWRVGTGPSTLCKARYPMDLQSFCRAIPKAELHVHFTGAVPLDTFLLLAERNGIDLPAQGAPADVYARGENFDRVLKTLKLVCRSLLSADDFHRAVYDTQRQAAESGVRYREMFWNPTDHWSIGEVTYAESLDGMSAGLRDAERDFGIAGRLVPSIDRESSPELGFEMVEAVVARPRDEVIGIGMDYLEVGHPPEKFWKAYRLAERSGLRRTAHAGEFGEPARNVETALDLLGMRPHRSRLHHIAGRASACALP